MFDTLKIWSYLLRGRKPWTPGYLPYRAQQITATLQNPALMKLFANVNHLPEKYALNLDERLVEFPWILSQLPTTPGNLLDAGSTINHPFIINEPVFANKDVTIMTLAPEDKSFWQKRISYVYGDLRNVPFRSDWFDSITCISTLEHVGMNNDVYTTDVTYHEADTKSHLEVISEFTRILKKGGRLYLTLPYGIFKLCGFQQVFNAEMVQAVKARFAGKLITETYYRYTTAGWQLATAADCANCDYFNINATKEKSYESDYAAAARAVVCLILEK
ncbi:MAG: hypothetical protein ACD_43C00217G0006 [uncultured bacterium]|nr:MAG: hypothetical protein ACD_43C00217G0006 [uncultured bacterium]